MLFNTKLDLLTFEQRDIADHKLSFHKSSGNCDDKKLTTPVLQLLLMQDNQAEE